VQIIIYGINNVRGYFTKVDGQLLYGINFYHNFGLFNKPNMYGPKKKEKNNRSNIYKLLHN
jgi:hypothetical protein